MNAHSKQKIDEARAAELLGLSPLELRRLSLEAGLGHAKSCQDSASLEFTYAELYRLCRSAVQIAG